MTRRRQLSPAVPSADVDGLLYVLNDYLWKVDTFISTAEELIERSWEGDGGDDLDDLDDGDDSILRRRNHVMHLVESAKLAVREAVSTGQELGALARRRRGA